MRRTNSVLSDIWNHRLGRTGIILTVTLVLCSLIIPIVSPYEIDEVDLMNSYQPPSVTHWLGTDELGRDVFTRAFYAGRVSVAVGISGTIVSIFLGTLLGAISGYYGGILDAILLKIHEIQYCFPPIILVVALMAILGGGIGRLILFLGLFMWPTTYRITRNLVYAIKKEAFVEGARLMGNNSVKIIFKHILPNTIPTLIVNATLLVAEIVLLEAALSFLGIGVRPPIPSWGNMLNLAKNILVLSQKWWLWLPPGVLLFCFVLGINFLGEALDSIMSPYSSDIRRSRVKRECRMNGRDTPRKETEC